jgi:hypothetical protein
MPAVILPVLAFVLFLAIFYVRDQRRHTPVGSVAVPEIPLRSYTGGMRWEPQMNATLPFARLAISAGGITAGPSARFVPLVPTLAFRWEELTIIEPVGWTLVPFIADGVRFRTADKCFIFWTGSSWRTNSVLDVCESASLRPLSRKRQRAPIYGCR